MFKNLLDNFRTQDESNDNLKIILKLYKIHLDEAEKKRRKIGYGFFVQDPDVVEVFLMSLVTDNIGWLSERLKDTIFKIKQDKWNELVEYINQNKKSIIEKINKKY